ncbi:uncharacterized protein LOC128228967 [Mya arenaria]|nr:uncharacterized protein LOC128228967 [Mya arenaria]
MPRSQTAKANAPAQCRRHNGELITVFSSKFERCMCLKCAMEQHDLLGDFMPISEGVELMRSTGKALLDEVSLMTETTKMLRKDRNKFIEKIRSSEKNIKVQVRKMKDKITRHLDLLEQKFMTKLKRLVENNERVFQKDQHVISLIETELKKIKENVNVKLKTGSDTDLITGIVEEKVSFNNKKLDIKSQQGRVPTKSLQFRMSQSVLDFLQNVKDLGDVSLQLPFEEFNDDVSNYSPEPPSFRSAMVPVAMATHPHAFPTSTPIPFTSHGSPRSHTHSQGYPQSRANNKYGIHVSNPYHSYNAQLNNQQVPNGGVPFRDEYGDATTNPYGDFEGIRDDPIVLTSDHTGTCNLSGVAALSSGRIIVCDSKHKCIQLINRRSDILDELVFHYKPCSIATVSENDVVVSFTEKDFISIFNASMKSLKHKRDLSISGRGGSYSVAHSKNTFAVCRRGEIKVVSGVDSSLINTIQIEAHFPQIAMSDSGTKIYISDFVGGRVTCMNEIGKVKWEYSLDDLEPCSLAVDLNQLFVADVKGKILIMSTYGILVRQLQCQGHLNALSVDSNTGTLLVTQESNRDKQQSRSIKIVAL